MSDSVKIVGTPFEDGQSKKEVRKALNEAFPGYRVSSILRDDDNERWLARLVEQTDRVHHKVAEGDAPFPLKELGPGEEKDDDEDKEEDSDDSDKGEEPKTNEDDDELEPDEKPAEDDKADVKGELAGLLKQFKKLLPALEKVVGPIDEDEGPEHLDKALEDVGPVPGGPPPPGVGGPPPGPPPAAPAGPGRTPPGVPAPGRRPPMPGGGGRRPAGPPRPGVPAFSSAYSSAQQLPLQRMADVTEEEARTEVSELYPDYDIADFKKDAGLYKVILERKQAT